MPEENLLQQEAKMMKLEKLIAEREGVSTKPFPVPVPDCWPATGNCTPARSTT
jgi:hypothetical protein